MTLVPEGGTIMTNQVISATLTELWQEILKTRVGAQDDFFDLGGDSLAAIRMITEVQSIYRVDLDVETFFTAPCIDNLATAIVEASRANPVGNPDRETVS
jgi:acyl carrier protein